MQTIPLADTGRETTRLGFGCSSLMGAIDRRESLRLLESAFDAGIRHFDVAPMYGYGEAESCLGDFLQNHRGQITITTKYGIAPARNSTLIRVGRRIAAPILSHLPSLKQSLARAANAVTRNPPDRQHHHPTFTATQAKASLDRSLIALRTERIDLWLLHEATADDLQDDSLIEFLEAEVEKGTIGSFGVGSSADKIPLLLAERPDYCRTLQYEWSVLSAPIPESPIEPFRIHHRSLTEKFRSIHTAILSNQILNQRWSSATNSDLTNPEILAHLMLKAALVMNPGSIILFSSKNSRHIQANAQTAIDSTLEAPARQLYNLVQAEHDQLLIRTP